MLYRIISVLAITVFASACASTGGSHDPRQPAGVTPPTTPTVPIAMTDSTPSAPLTNIYSMQRSFWSDVRKGKEYYGRYAAFIVKNDMKNDDEKARVVIYLQDSSDTNNYDKMVKVADNGNFIYAGSWAGQEPNLDVNRKGSLMIVQGNDGVGRGRWHKSVTVRILANTGKIEVIGFDYDDYDSLQMDPAHGCSYNFLTGAAKSWTMPTAENRPTKQNKVKGIKQTVDLNDWTEAMEPKDCIQ